tara:strand:- start:3766 stop:4785 length:1020 start_codon:yes stop_codon:yes gene_type:complete
MSNFFKKKTILISGGTGSFGNAVLKRILIEDVKEVRIFSRDEKKQNDMRLKFLDERIKFHIGDVRDYQSISDSLSGVDFVFHAAALKQVPSCEFYPMQAVQTNILGSNNVLSAIQEQNVKKGVFLSTDKAVYPINAMGMTKALMEKNMIATSHRLKHKEAVVCCTRYGNVMGSRGSVIPLFIDQIMNGSEITITDPDMTRFLMSLEDSVDLVFYAFQNAKPGDIFVQKAPACTILDLTKALKDIFNSKIKVKTIGTRHGEKLYESLLSREEVFKSEDHGNYFRIPADTRDLNYKEFFSSGEKSISNVEDYTSHNTIRLNVEETKNILLKLDIVNEALNA